MSSSITNGWHTVAAIKYSDVNKALAAGASPAMFTYTAKDGSANTTASFGPWSITTGGWGPTIMMALPINKGTVTVGTTKVDVPLTPCTAIVKITANFLAQEGVGKPQLFKLQNSTAQPMSVESCLPAQTDVIVDGVFRQLLQQWLNENQSLFHALFGAIDFDADFANGHDYLKPSWKGYAVAEPGIPTLDNSVFAILTLIDDELPDPDLVFEVSQHAIPAGSDAAFLLSSDKYLQHILLPACPHLFSGIENDPPDKHFVIDNDGTRIRSSESLTLQPFYLANGNTVSDGVIPEGHFTMQIDGSELVFGYTGLTFEPHAGITMHLNYSNRSTVSLDANGLLDFAVVAEDSSGSATTSAFLDGLVVAGAVVGAVAGALGGFGGVVARSAGSAAEAATAGDEAAAAARAASEDAAAAAPREPSVSVGGRPSELEMAAATRGSTIFGAVRLPVPAAPPLEAVKSMAFCFVNRTAVEWTQWAKNATTLYKVCAAVAAVGGGVSSLTKAMEAILENGYDSLPKIEDLTTTAVGKVVQWHPAVPKFTLKSVQQNGALQFGLVHSATAAPLKT